MPTNCKFFSMLLSCLETCLVKVKKLVVHLLHKALKTLALKYQVGTVLHTKRQEFSHFDILWIFSGMQWACTHETYHHDPQTLPVNLITITWCHMTPTWYNVLIYKLSFRKTLARLLQQYLEVRSRTWITVGTCKIAYLGPIFYRSPAVCAQRGKTVIFEVPRA